MKRITFLFTLLISIWFSISCNKDFLNQLPETTRTTNTVYQTSSDFYNAVTGAYSSFKLNGLYGRCDISSALLNLGEVVTDNSDYGATRAVSNVSIFELQDFNYSLSNTYFSSAWTDHYIGISRANTILAKLPDATFDETLKARFEAEAKFLRGLFYFDLVRLFGDVQLITTPVSDPNAGYDIQRSTAADVYTQIISDLTFAEENLPSTISQSEAGRASKWAVKALLGKVYLTQKDYAKAATKLNDIITSNQFGLTNSYADVFSATTPFTANKDVILSVQYKSGQIGQGSAIWSSCIPWNAPGAQFGISGGSGGGFMRPTVDIDTSYENGDLRKTASIAESYLNGSTTVYERYVTKYSQPGTIAGDADIDFPVIRYADVLLMYSECLNEQNQTAAAIPFVNEVRTRAGLPDKPTTLTQDEARIIIEKERRLELAFEGQRWFDLVRTGRFVQVMNAKGYPTKDYQNLYPVPQRETDLNSGITQNSGY